ncbi:protein Smaug [Anopheles bellator]|uniref:protein Smaug n=1 Tax=Anopheles bellator TaxID=139047 RepID=UPI002649AD3C|nr:protein Smaug [Anopheles bellator]
MKYPGGNPSTMFCEQVSTVTSLFEQWNDCERTVVLYALLKRVPSVNLKFLQVSIDYNLAQNCPSEVKLHELEARANDTTLLRMLVQRYYQLSGGGHSAAGSSLTGGLQLNNNNNNTNSVNNNLKAQPESSSLYELLKKSITHGPSGHHHHHHHLVSNNLLSPSSNESSVSSSSCSSTTSSSVTATITSPRMVPMALRSQKVDDHEERPPETMENILKDILNYLPLLTPGNDIAKSMYMSLIPGAVEDACRQLVPTEIVQQTLSYLLIHPAITNDDRRILSCLLRHLEDFISTSYVPATAASVPATVNKGRNYFQHQNSATGASHINATVAGGNAQGPYLSATVSTGAGKIPWQHGSLGIPVPPPSTHSSTHSLTQTQMVPTGTSQKHSHSSLTTGGASPQPAPCQTKATTAVMGRTGCSVSNWNSTSSSSSSSSSPTSSSSCLDSAASQLLKSSTQHPPPTVSAEFGIVRVQQHRAGTTSALIASSQTMHTGTGVGQLPEASQSSSSVNAGNGSTPVTDDLITAATESLLYDSPTDDHHVSFSKNGTEIFDYDCDFDHEDEYNYLRQRNTTSATATSSSGGGPSIGGKKLVSFNSNVSNDFLCVPLLLNGYGCGGASGLDHDLDGTLMKTRRSNSLTTTPSSALSAAMIAASFGGVPGGGEMLYAQQKQNNECLSAENLTNLQMLQNKPRSFSLTMESPRSSLTSSGSDTQLDEFKHHHQGPVGLMKLYGGQPNLGMSCIAHWLKSLRLHKYVWLFSNLTYDQMLDITEEYLQNLSVTKGARHKLALCIQKLKERFSILRQLEKDLLGGQTAGPQLATVLEELTNIVLTPMKPIGIDQREDVAAQFVKVLDLVGSIIVLRPINSQQDEEYLNIFLWILERALHNDAFVAHFAQIKDHKYKLSKVKIQLAPKSGHFPKNLTTAGVNSSISKPRWPVNNKHKSGGVLNEPQAKPHRKSSIPYFLPPGGQLQGSTGQAQQYFHHTAASNANGSTANYNKSSSYPSFVTTHGNGVALHGMKPMTTGGSSNNSSLQQQQQPHQMQYPHASGISNHQHPAAAAASLQPPAMQHPNFMFHRHSLSNITPHGAGSLVPPVFLSNLNSVSAENCSGAGGDRAAACGPTSKASSASSMNVRGVGDRQNERSVKNFPTNQAGNDGSSSGGNSSNVGHNNSIGDINTRLEFLCRQMTEQAIN